jgi:hypothetical protein
VSKRTPKKPQRQKLYVARVDGQVAGVSHGYTESDAIRLFAAERGIPAACIEVVWTGKREVSVCEFQVAMEAQADYLAGRGR